MGDVEAFSVSSGPGSYTGLRIGASTAKGLAYATNKPLIAVSTLEAMICGIRPFYADSVYFCPMIDARRMEVYCMLVSGEEQIWETSALIVEKNVFDAYQDHPLILFGDGALKTKQILNQPNLHWVEEVHPSAEQIGMLAESRFNDGRFENVAYFEPFYLKEFQAKPSRKLLD